jgi:hypothetical protein
MYIIDYIILHNILLYGESHLTQKPGLSVKKKLILKRLSACNNANLWVNN